jgi:hypothetical protein
MPDPQYLSTDPNAGQYLSSDPNAGTPITVEPAKTDTPAQGGAMDALGRGLSSFWEQVSPVAAVKGLAHAALDLTGTVKAIGEAQGAEYTKASDAFGKGDYVTGARHGLAYLLPIIGPALSQQSDKMQQGDIAGGIGGTLGIAASLAGPEAAKAAVSGVAKIPAMLPEAAADTADAMANRRMVDVIAPKGQSRAKLQLGNVAEKIAPKLLREPELGAVSRQAFAEKVGSKLDEATDALDAANSARPAGSSLPTAQVISDLQAQRARFTTSNGKVPDPFVDRVSQIDDAIKAVRKLGPNATYDDLKVIRQAYDDRAKASYNAATTPNYGQAMGQKQGAGDVAATIRQHLSKADPTTAEANARYSLFKNAQDVLQATEEVERTKPKVGRQMIAKAAGTAVGGEMGGMPGMVAGYVLAPILDSAVSSGVTTKIATARLLAQMADAIRSGNQSLANAKLLQLASVTGKTSQVRALLGGQMPAALPVAAQAQPTEPQ